MFCFAKLDTFPAPSVPISIQLDLNDCGTDLQYDRSVLMDSHTSNDFFAHSLMPQPSVSCKIAFDREGIGCAGGDSDH